jgi:hypothetical protein
MAKTEFKTPQDVHVKLPSGGLFDEIAPIYATVTEMKWLDLPSTPPPGKYGPFPYDSAPVFLGQLLENNNIVSVEAQWRTTREWDKVKMGWMPTGFWTRRNSGGRRIDFEPLGYRELVE